MQLTPDACTEIQYAYKYVMRMTPTTIVKEIQREQVTGRRERARNSRGYTRKRRRGGTQVVGGEEREEQYLAVCNTSGACCPTNE